jgi:hypothetical protein
LKTPPGLIQSRRDPSGSSPQLIFDERQQRVTSEHKAPGNDDNNNSSSNNNDKTEPIDCVY